MKRNIKDSSGFFFKFNSWADTNIIPSNAPYYGENRFADIKKKLWMKIAQ